MKTIELTFENSQKLKNDLASESVISILDKFSNRKEEYEILSKAVEILNNSPDENSAKICLREVKDILNKAEIIPEINAAYRVVDSALIDLQNKPLNEMKSTTNEYFKKIYPDQKKIEFGIKEKGCQMGFKYTILTEENRKIMFFVKTHGWGFTSQNKSNSSSIDLKEIFVLYFLNGLTIGAEVQFFGTSQSLVYIASKSMEEDGYQDMSSILKSYLHGDGIFMKRGLIICEFITRALGLCDIIENPDNFGFSIKNGKIENLKITDFYFKSNELFSENIVNGFKIGYNYAKMDPLIKKCLSESSADERKTIAYEMFNDLFSNYENIINDSLNKVKGFYFFENSESEEKEDLHNYIKWVLKNLNDFAVFLDYRK